MLASLAGVLASLAVNPPLARAADPAWHQPDGGSAGAHFFGGDDRVVVKPTALPWRAIGKVITTRDGYCTGTLIGPDIVLTSAHCVFEQKQNDYVLQQPIYFLAGYHDGRFAAVSAITDLWVPPGFDMVGFADTFDHDHEDVALLRLEAPIGEEIGWLQLADLSDPAFRATLLGVDGPKVSQAGYSGDVSNRLTAHIGCQIVQFQDNDTILHQCDTAEGDSGSPLFFRQDEEYWLIAVESQLLRVDGRFLNGAVDTRAFSDAARNFSSDTKR